jgi:TM2 domain-containing membrane protein YozV
MKKMKSKILLVLIETLGLGALGLDRLYLGCPSSGLMKFVLFLLTIFSYYTNDFLFYASSLIWVTWVLFDYVLVFINAFLQSQNNPFCNELVYYNDVDLAPWFLTLLVLVDFAAAILAGCYYLGPFSLFY